MSTISRKLAKRLGVALNEASWIDVKIESEIPVVKCAFEVISVSADGKVPEDNIVIITFGPVSRIIASFRTSQSEDQQQKVHNLRPVQLAKILRSFHDHFIYGWEFINCGDKAIKHWRNKLSFDHKFDAQAGYSNTIDLFQDEGFSKQLTVRIWFDGLIIRDKTGGLIELETFIENGERAWNKIFEGNSDTKGFGIVPAD